MIYQIVLDKTVGIYGHDAEGRPWTTFQTMNHTVVCDECGKEIKSGWICGRLGEACIHVCSSHVEIAKEART